ncbi:MAG: hypothetical protein LBH51_05110 [Treponema sp.]|jgi:hypothetical protein|nr:hypothetical protein [Treponema sp.]
MEKYGAEDSLIGDAKETLKKNITSELKKEAAEIDPDCIDRRIDELYALEGLDPPRLNAEALDAAARTIRARAAWRRRNRLAEEARKRRFARRTVRGVMAACCLALFSFSANYAAALATGSCFPSKLGVTICCGTKFCPCDTAPAEEPGHPK